MEIRKKLDHGGGFADLSCKRRGVFRFAFRGRAEGGAFGDVAQVVKG